MSPELDAEDASYYQSLIGVLRWIVELGRVDICLEVSMLSSHLALPREGHMQQVFQTFAYLKKYHNTELVYDPSNPVVDMLQFQRHDWTASEFGHIEGREELPPNMPEPQGVGFIMRAGVDYMLLSAKVRLYYCQEIGIMVPNKKRKKGEITELILNHVSG